MSNPTEFTISRTFDAPRAKVWKAFTDGESLRQWWGPKEFDTFHATMDFRPGGTFLYGMKAKGGAMEMWGKFIYREIEEPNHIAFVSTFSDKDGNLTRAPFFDGRWPLEVLTIIDFEEQDGKTTVRLRGGPINATPEEMELHASQHESMRGGFGGTFDQLAEYLKNN